MNNRLLVAGLLLGLVIPASAQVVLKIARVPAFCRYAVRGGFLQWLESA